MKITKEFLEKIKPKVKGKSDKYSDYLFRFFKRRSNINWRVVSLQTSIGDGSFQKFDKKKSLILYDILFVDGDCSRSFLGKKLSGIVSQQKGFTMIYSYVIENKDRILDITDWFFEVYIKIGRAIYDRDGTKYLMHNDERWDYSEDLNYRKCLWSGIEQKKEIEIVKREVVKWNVT